LGRKRISKREKEWSMRWKEKEHRRTGVIEAKRRYYFELKGEIGYSKCC
jgi:hypothetical protein